MNHSASNIKHIVIIYEKTGGGHLKAAQILERLLSNANIKITLITASELAQDENNIFVCAWNYFIRRNWLLTADILLNFILRISLLPLYYCIYPQLIFSQLDQLKPDIIISTSDCNRLFGSYCAERKIPFFIFITEAAIFVDMLSPHATHLVYFKEVADIINSFENTSYFTSNITDKTSIINRAHDALKQWIRYSIGYPLTPYFKRYHKLIKQKNKLATFVMGPLREQNYYQLDDPLIIKQRYNIPIDGYNIIISNGSLGGTTVKKILNAIVNNNISNLKLSLIVICGLDTSLYNYLVNLSGFNNEILIVPVAKQSSLAQLYQIADCSIGRGTAGILMDGLISQTPLIVLNRITANDLGTLDIIKQYNIGEIAQGYYDVPRLLEKVLLDQKVYKMSTNKLLIDYQANNYEAIQAKIRKVILGT